MREVLAGEVLPCSTQVSIEVSVGIAVAGEDGRTPEELLGAADVAMYSDKRALKHVAAAVMAAV